MARHPAGPRCDDNASRTAGDRNGIADGQGLGPVPGRLCHLRGAAVGVRPCQCCRARGHGDPSALLPGGAWCPRLSLRRRSSPWSPWRRGSPACTPPTSASSAVCSSRVDETADRHDRPGCCRSREVGAIPCRRRQAVHAVHGRGHRPGGGAPGLAALSSRLESTPQFRKYPRVGPGAATGNRPRSGAAGALGLRVVDVRLVRRTRWRLIPGKPEGRLPRGLAGMTMGPWRFRALDD